MMMTVYFSFYSDHTSKWSRFEISIIPVYSFFCSTTHFLQNFLLWRIIHLQLQSALYCRTSLINSQHFYVQSKVHFAFSPIDLQDSALTGSRRLLSSCHFKEIIDITDLQILAYCSYLCYIFDIILIFCLKKTQNIYKS